MNSCQTAATQGFYVFQTSLGSPLQFHPALGTPELDSLVDAYLPLPATPQEKRAAISVDFFQHSTLTGESIKFYQIPDFCLSSATNSPTSSNQDSGYGSFNPSPIAPTWSFDSIVSPTTASTPSTSSSSVSTPQLSSRRSSQQSAASASASSRRRVNDFSHLPGMKILTKDGRDVTNTATRGCKTKEQREHAHLMRIMKACDSCKKKKVRCDPSHRTSAESVSSTQRTSKQAKKLLAVAKNHRPVVAAPPAEPNVLSSTTPLVTAPSSFELDQFDASLLAVSEEWDWDAFIGAGEGLDNNMLPNDILASPAIEGILAPAWSQQLSTPSDFSSSNLSPPGTQPNPGTINPAPSQPQLPYVGDNDTPHDYLDFNLYSPDPNFLDVEDAIAADSSGRLIDSPPDKFTQPPDRLREGGINQPQASATIATGHQPSVVGRSLAALQAQALASSSPSTTVSCSPQNHAGTSAVSTAALLSPCILATCLSPQQQAVGLAWSGQTQVLPGDQHVTTRLETREAQIAASLTSPSSRGGLESVLADNITQDQPLDPGRRHESQHELPDYQGSGILQDESSRHINRASHAQEDDEAHHSMIARDGAPHTASSSDEPTVSDKTKSRRPDGILSETQLPMSVVMTKSQQSPGGDDEKILSLSTMGDTASPVTVSTPTPELLAFASALVSTLLQSLSSPFVARALASASMPATDKKCSATNTLSGAFSGVKLRGLRGNGSSELGRLVGGRSPAVHRMPMATAMVTVSV